MQAELVGQLVGLVLGDRQQVQGHQVPFVVVQDQAEGDPPILPGKEFRPDLGVAAEHRVDLGQVAVALFPHGKGQAALADLPVAAALVGDGVEIPLHRQVAGADQFGHRLGKVKVLHPVVAEGEVRQGGEVHRAGHPRHQVEDEKLDVQFVVNEPHGLPSRSAPGGVAGPIIASLRGKDKGFFSREEGGWARKGVGFQRIRTI